MSLVITRASANNTTSSIYTVTSGKQLYLVATWFEIANESGATDVANMHYRDDSPALVDYFYLLTCLDNQQIVVANNYYPNLVIPGDYDIRIVSGAANLYVRGGIMGFETT